MTERADCYIPCAEVIRAIWTYLDSEADADLADRIRAHLDICLPCREQYAFEGAFLRSLPALLAADADVSSLRSRIVQALADEEFRTAPGMDV